jgi:hypothetical protein
MIRTEAEYEYAKACIAKGEELMAVEGARLKKEGYAPEEIKRGLDPSRAFRSRYLDEVTSYERLKRGEFGELRNFQGIGPLLVGLRIYRGISQRELAEKLGVHESQVSRDERHEYAGLTLDRAGNILKALGVQLKTVVSKSASRGSRAARRGVSRWRRGARQAQHVAK